MNIVYSWPPNIAEIAAVLPASRSMPGVLFCYGDTIFNPYRVAIPQPLIVHEKVHSVRQGNDPAQWWKRYLADRDFRFAEELVAHKAEYLAAIRGVSRPQRRRILSQIASRLTSPLYGGNTSVLTAKRLIEDARSEIDAPSHPEPSEASTS